MAATVKLQPSTIVGSSWVKTVAFWYVPDLDYTFYQERPVNRYADDPNGK